MNKRTFLNGLGIGLIVGAVMLQLMLAVSGDASTAKGADGTDKQYTEAEFKTALEAKLKEELEKRPVLTPMPASSATPKPSESKPKQTVLYIASGLPSEKVVEMLYQSGLVPDPINFASELKKRELNGKIRSGVHLFEGSPNMEAIMSQLAPTQP